MLQRGRVQFGNTSCLLNEKKPLLQGVQRRGGKKKFDKRREKTPRNRPGRCRVVASGEKSVSPSRNRLEKERNYE